MTNKILAEDGSQILFENGSDYVRREKIQPALGFKMPGGPCCCAACIIQQQQSPATGDFDQWTEGSFDYLEGDWAFNAALGPTLVTTGADGLVVLKKKSRDSDQRLRVSFETGAGPAQFAGGSQFGIVLAFADDENYLYAEWDYLEFEGLKGGTLRLWKVVAGVMTELAKTPSAAVISASHPNSFQVGMEACYNHTTGKFRASFLSYAYGWSGTEDYSATVNSGIQHLEVTVHPPTLGKQAGLKNRAFATGLAVTIREFWMRDGLCKECATACINHQDSGVESTLENYEVVSGTWTREDTTGSFAHAVRGAGAGILLTKNTGRSPTVLRVAPIADSGTARARLLVDYVDADNYHYLEANYTTSGDSEFGRREGGSDTALLTIPDSRFKFVGGFDIVFFQSATWSLAINSHMLLTPDIYGSSGPGLQWSGRGVFTSPLGGTRVGFQVVSGTWDLYGVDHRDLVDDFVAGPNACKATSIYKPCEQLPESVLWTISGLAGDSAACNGAFTASWSGYGEWEWTFGYIPSGGFQTALLDLGASVDIGGFPKTKFRYIAAFSHVDWPKVALLFYAADGTLPVRVAEWGHDLTDVGPDCRELLLTDYAGQYDHADFPGDSTITTQTMEAL